MQTTARKETFRKAVLRNPKRAKIFELMSHGLTESETSMQLGIDIEELRREVKVIRRGYDI